MSVLVDLKSLIKRLNPVLTEALEGAVGLCMSKTHYEIGIEHWLIKLLELKDHDIEIIFAYYDIDTKEIIKLLKDSLKNFDTGNTAKPGFSPLLMELVQDAWSVTSLQFSESEIRSGYVLLALLNKRMTLNYLGLSNQLRVLSPSALNENFAQYTNRSIEESKTVTDEKPLKKTNGDSAIDQYCEDLTEKAKNGKIDPIFGREVELEQMLDIFCRRRKNNPILVGEPGVGKTAVVEGLALKIAENDVPEILKNTRILSLDITLLEAGASVKGEFEKRLMAVIEEVKASEIPIILFIDEAHRLIGAGGQAGNDAANILKPALSRGELRTVAATTWKEYKQYFEKDPALTRRFQLVKLDVPNDQTTVTIMRGLKSRYMKDHGVVIRDDAVLASVSLASRYIVGKNQPDKSIDLVDTCAARVKVSLSSKPSKINRLEKEVQAFEREKEALCDDQKRGVKAENEKLEELDKKIEKLNLEIKTLTEKWQKELALISKLQAVQTQLILPNTNQNKTEDNQKEDQDQNDQAQELSEEVLIAKRDQLSSDLEVLQDGEPLVFFEVSPDIVAQVVSDWTGIPLGKVLRDESESLLNLNCALSDRIKGQAHAIDIISEQLKMAKAGLKAPEQPMGVFLLVGPSGVGKTETALTIADVLFGGDQAITTINMSEFQEKHTISRLIGSPPGYVGFGEGGVLTEAVRQRPYSVVLLDEIEKASLDVLNLFYQVFDKGVLNDGEGKQIDFSNTVIILTSNLATDEIMHLTHENPEISYEDLVKNIRPTLSQWLKPALLARTTVVPYHALSNEALTGIVKLKLDKFAKRLKDQNKITLDYHSDVLEQIASRCLDVDTGARNVDAILKSNIMPKLSEILLSSLCDGSNVNSIAIKKEEVSGEFEYEVL